MTHTWIGPIRHYTKNANFQKISIFEVHNFLFYYDICSSVSIQLHRYMYDLSKYKRIIHLKCSY